MWFLEPVKYCMAAPKESGAKDAHIHLHAGAQLETDLVLALGQYFQDAGKSQDLFDHGSAPRDLRAMAGNQDIEIADRLAAAAQGTGRRDLLDAWHVR